MPDHPAQGSPAGDLRESQAQAEAGLSYGARGRHRDSREQAGVGVAHLRLRAWQDARAEDPERGERPRADAHQGPQRGPAHARELDRGQELRGRGRAAAPDPAERPALEGYRLVSRIAASPRAAGARPADADQRADAEGSPE